MLQVYSMSSIAFGLSRYNSILFSPKVSHMTVSLSPYLLNEVAIRVTAIYTP